nr:MAG TPA: hypothetical protein [Caudoviricetes sp.]
MRRGVKCKDTFGSTFLAILKTNTYLGVFIMVSNPIG